MPHREKDIARQRVKHILQSGANVIVTTQVRRTEIAAAHIVQFPDDCQDIHSKQLSFSRLYGAGLRLQGIDDMCLKYFVEAGALAVRRVSKKDIRRIAKATGGRIEVHS